MTPQFMLEQFLDNLYCMLAAIETTEMDDEGKEALTYYSQNLGAMAEELATLVSEHDNYQYEAEAGKNFFKAWLALESEDSSKHRSMFNMARAKMGMIT